MIKDMFLLPLLKNCKNPFLIILKQNPKIYETENNSTNPVFIKGYNYQSNHLTILKRAIYDFIK
jgi:hypothetical protein